jgi:hypothetical protein
MSLGIGLLSLLLGGVAIYAIAALLRWLTMTLSGTHVGSVWDWFWTILDILSSF